MMKDGLNIPEICCTCKNWAPYQDDITLGTCTHALMSTNFDDKCDEWGDCGHEDVVMCTTMPH